MQSTLPKLNFPAIKMRARRSADSVSVWDNIRQCYIVLTPEEWVRQHLIAFLTTHLNIPERQISLEYPVKINHQNQRADVVALDRNGRPTIVAECKAPNVNITQSTLDQAVRYNSVIGAEYIILTNGLSHHIYRRVDEQGGYSPLSDFSEIAI